MHEESDEDVEGEDEEAASRHEARRRLKKETEVRHTLGFSWSNIDSCVLQVC